MAHFCDNTFTCRMQHYYLTHYTLARICHFHWSTIKIMHEGRAFAWRMPGLSVLFYGIHIYLIAKKKCFFLLKWLPHAFNLSFFTGYCLISYYSWCTRQRGEAKLSLWKKNMEAPWKHMECLWIIFPKCTRLIAEMIVFRFKALRCHLKVVGISSEAMQWIYLYGLSLPFRSKLFFQINNTKWLLQEQYFPVN